jgi:hypothetical protein
MSNFYPENYYEGDSEDQEDVVWNELNWYQYLGRNKREIRKLIDCYKKVKHNRSGYLEELTKMMGWTSFAFFDFEEQSEETYVDPSNTASQNEEEYEVIEVEPYTIHRNPLNIFSQGLYQYIQEQCEQLLVVQKDISPISMWRLSATISEGQSNIILATYSIDLGDYMLAICHLKLALKAINESLQVLGQLPITSQGREISMALFSLREVFIKISNDCREYDQSELGDGE